jgi:hypothetical protein
MVEQVREVASRATPGPWKLWGMQVLADLDGTSNVDTAEMVAHTTGRPSDALRTWNASHIAAHDPASVLADCDRMVRLLDVAESLETFGTGWTAATLVDVVTGWALGHGATRPEVAG